ncbi:hypothetical protein BP5796_04973 [Coleophoma crateriformis]|uniref:Late sexual development protein n=1 Tax=Coleophoma crateriformis TaxID=565419 RepID=A0A3D8SAS6_9HELO|nr:hypothetical protein BP5796_04973 [Coleophoma crateriformis]
MACSRMALAIVIRLACLTAVFAAPFSFKDNPLGNGFPMIVQPSDALTVVSVAAHGSLPNSPPPPNKPSADALTSLRLIAFNELFEVAYFTELLNNITNNVEGYEVGGKDDARNFMIKALTAVQAQEELHVLNANGAITHFGGEAVQPCTYNFPVTNINDAITLAQTFTDVVLGTLQDVVSLFGTDGDIALIRGVSSVIGQEGEQNGWYRTFLGKVPSALPFLTTSTREFAFSALQGFVVPGSCPNLDSIKLQIFKPLTVITANPEPKEQDITFSVEIAKDSDWMSSYSITYINQQNLPINKPISNVNIVDRTVTFTANFPYDMATFGNGMTIAAVTNSTGSFDSASDVAKATVFGPGLIEIN